MLEEDKHQSEGFITTWQPKSIFTQSSKQSDLYIQINRFYLFFIVKLYLYILPPAFCGIFLTIYIQIQILLSYLLFFDYHAQHLDKVLVCANLLGNKSDSDKHVTMQTGLQVVILSSCLILFYFKTEQQLKSIL